MGISRTQTHAMHKEIKARAGMMYSEYRSMMKRVFKNTDLATSIRVPLGEITLHSRLFSGAGIWDKLGTAALSTLRAAYMAPFRSSADMVNHK